MREKEKEIAFKYKNDYEQFASYMIQCYLTCQMEQRDSSILTPVFEQCFVRDSNNQIQIYPYPIKNRIGMKIPVKIHFTTRQGIAICVWLNKVAEQFPENQKYPIRQLQLDIMEAKAKYKVPKERN